MGRRLVIADIHGGHKALIQVFERASVDFDNDRLICLGDTCDGWPDIKECFDELFKFKNMIYVIGNHDEWARQNYSDGFEPPGWYEQGGKPTLDSFGETMPEKIENLLNLEAKNFHIEDGMLFVHGGFNPVVPIENHSRERLIWDRGLVHKANYAMAMHEKHGHEAKITPYDKVFIGHTPTIIYKQVTPIKNCEVIMIDTGASYTGPLTIMDIDTEEYWQSDSVCNFYPGIRARGHSRY